MKTTLDRSRCRTSGSAATRASIVGVAVKLVIRKRSIVSTNQCRVELFEYHQVVAAQQDEEGGEAVGVIHRRGHHDGLRLGHRRPVRQERLALLRDPQRRRQVEDHFGYAGRTAAADSVGGGGNGCGQRAFGLCRRQRGSSSHRLVRRRPRRDRSPRAPGRAPIRADPNAWEWEPRRSSSSPAWPAPGVRIRDGKWPQANPFRRRWQPAPVPTDWRGRRVHRRSAPARCRRARQQSPPCSSRRCSASSGSLVPNGIPSSNGLDADAGAGSVLV